MPASTISLEQAKKDKLFYFVASVVIFRESDGRCLILKRDLREKVHPGKYGVVGGKLEWNDFDLTKPTRVNGEVIDFENAVENLLQREALEEAGVTLKDNFAYINSAVLVRPDGIPVVLVNFAAQHKEGDVKLEQGAFTDYAWVNDVEIERYDCIEGIHEEVKRTVELFRR